MENNNGNKYIFGAYLNTAYDNFFNTCTLIINRVNNQNKKYTKWSDIKQALDKFNPQTQGISYSKLIRECDRYFPIFRLIDKEQKLEYVDLLNRIYNQLNNLRNFHTHLIHDPYIINQINHTDLVELLNHIYDQAVRLISKRMDIHGTNMAHLYRLDKKGQANTYFKYNFEITDSNLPSRQFTEYGLAFFTCLFLSKRDGMNLLKKISGFKRGDEVPFRLTTEVFTAMRMNLPKQSLKLIQRQTEKESIALDILNEITKCPKELINHLSAETQKDFLICNDEDGSITGARIRYKDRFEQQILKVLEEDESFKDLGFYLYLGHCYLRQYDKAYIDGSNDKRTITKQLYAFAKLHKSYNELNLPHTIEQINEEDAPEDSVYLSKFGKQLHVSSGLPVTHTTYSETTEESVDETTFPSIRESYPFFVVNDNKIGIKFLDETAKEYFPQFTSGANGELKVNNPVPDVWISKYELPAMAFYSYLFKHHSAELTDAKSVKQILQEAKAYYSNPKCKNQSSPSERMISGLDRYISECQDRINKISRCKETRNYKIGELADELTRDILWIQPSLNGGKDKVTGANFQALQYALARYGYMRNDLTRIFRQANLIDGKNKHPFLGAIDPTHYTDFLDFYQAYLNKEIDYLRNQKKKLAKGSVNIQFHPLRKLIKEANGQKEVRIPSSTFLGRNLFRDSISQAMLQIGIKHPTGLNVSQLINLYFTREDLGTNQSFYDEERTYRLRDPENNLRNHTQSVTDRANHLDKIYNTSDLKAKKRDILHNEQLIRMRQTQDQILFLWMKDLLPVEMNNLKGLKISELNNRLLDSIMEVSYNLKDLKKITIKGSIKLKDYARIMCFINETLPASLFKFISDLSEQDLTLNIEYIERETAAYDTLRPEVICLLQELENKCISFNCLPKQSKGGYYNFRKLMENIEMYLKTNGIDTAPLFLSLIVQLRNSFAHSEYPALGIFKSAGYCFIDRNRLIQIISGDAGNSHTNTIAYELKECLSVRIKNLIEFLDNTITKA